MKSLPTLKRNVLLLVVAVAMLATISFAVPALAGASTKATAKIINMQILITSEQKKPTTVEIYSATDATKYPAIVDIVLPADATIVSLEEFGADTTKRAKIDYRSAPSDLETKTDTTFQVKLEKQANFVMTLTFKTSFMDDTKMGDTPIANFGLIAPNDLQEIAYAFVAPKGTIGIGKNVERFPDSKKGEVYGMRYPDIKRGMMSTAGVAFVDKKKAAAETAAALGLDKKPEKFTWGSLITLNNVLYALIAILVMVVFVIVFVVAKTKRTDVE